MATVEVPDDVLAAVRADAKSRGFRDDASVLEQLARRHLSEVCAAGFERDGLTGLLTRQSLRRRISAETMGTSWTDRSLYRDRFLCVDLDQFKKYLSVHGMVDGDAVLRRLADEMRRHYGADDAYRFGGDEFIVVLGTREPWLPDLGADVTVTHAIVDVAVHRDPHGHRHLDDWIAVHLHGGVRASKVEGVRIECRDPEWLVRP